MIELQQVKKVFAGRLAVDDLNLNVRAGEIFGLLGHNGAGKEHHHRHDSWPGLANQWQD